MAPVVRCKAGSVPCAFTQASWVKLLVSEALQFLGLLCGWVDVVCFFVCPFFDLKQHFYLACGDDNLSTRVPWVLLFARPCMLARWLPIPNRIVCYSASCRAKIAKGTNQIKSFPQSRHDHHTWHRNEEHCRTIIITSAITEHSTMLQRLRLSRFMCASTAAVERSSSHSEKRHLQSERWTLIIPLALRTFPN